MANDAPQGQAAFYGDLEARIESIRGDGLYKVERVFSSRQLWPWSSLLRKLAATCSANGLSAT